MHSLIRPWLPPRVADLPIRTEDLGIYDDDDGGRTHYYSWYRWAAGLVQPACVLEIGVRLGYSGLALAVPGVAATFIGFDNESYLTGSNALATAALSTVYNSVVVHAVDTQGIDSLVPYLDNQIPQAIHIDGDHTFEGCRHDLRLAHEVLPTGGLLIVDDTSAADGPAQACAHFVAEHAQYAVLTLNAVFSFRGHYFMLRL